MLGVYVEYEWKHLDLVWFCDKKDREDEDPWLHVEHENDPSRLNDLLGKVKSSQSLNIIDIGYSPSLSEERAFVKSLEKLKRDYEDFEILAIIDAIAYDEIAYDESDSTPLQEYVCRYGRKTKILEAKTNYSEDSIRYAYILKKF